MSDDNASNADSSLEEAISRLRLEKEASERDFGNKRALFKKMYMDKEAELSQMSVTLQVWANELFFVDLNILV